MLSWVRGLDERSDGRARESAEVRRDVRETCRVSAPGDLIFLSDYTHESWRDSRLAMRIVENSDGDDAEMIMPVNLLLHDLLCGSETLWSAE